MLAFTQSAFGIRRSLASEAGLIADLRLASLLSLEMPNRSLAAIRAFMTRLPDIDPELIEGECYFVADHCGELLGGSGWSVLPHSYRAEHLVGEDGGAAGLRIDGSSILVRGFFLDPDLGRRGVGAALLAQVEAAAGRAGYAAAEIVVPATSQLYHRSLGFRPIGKLGLRVGRGDILPMLQMRRRFPVNLASAA